jgi:hypothetical protein
VLAVARGRVAGVDGGERRFCLDIGVIRDRLGRRVRSGFVVAVVAAVVIVVQLLVVQQVDVDLGLGGETDV